ncbi:uncharacterized protein G2W53_032151 [Senna tora]|uniref:Uncharacterized protein n=1 Tax=Senna tora TaxID=362788 RepID=A0A834W622_9FABA|nr:uncharacterized protein G2W53_032151 [Senna tora]
MMSFLWSLLGCFSDSSKRVSCEEEEGHDVRSRNDEGEAKSKNDVVKKTTSSSSPPIPITYFPVGSRLSLL